MERGCLGGKKMGEPLKNERVLEMTTAEYVGRLVTVIPFKFKEGTGPIIRFCKEEDIKSAVEWLNEEIKILSPKHKPKVKYGRNCYCKTCNKIREIEEKIKQTFLNLQEIKKKGE